MSTSLPKEIIALTRKSNWKAVKEFLKTFIKLTLKKDLPYNLIILDDEKEKNEEESVITHDIKNKKDIDYIDKIKEFSSISIYQFHKYYENNLYLTKNENAIIFFAKYMSDITNEINLDCFDFIIMLDSTSNPVFLSNTGDELDYNSIIEFFEHFDSEAVAIKVEDLEDKNLESFIFERISGKNAVWGDSETKSYKRWKDNIADWFRSNTGKYAYYGGNLTKKYRQYLENMFNMWQKLSENGHKDVNSDNLTRFLSFMKLF
jgi:hypothetical protein